MIVAANNIICKIASEWKKKAWEKNYGILCNKEYTRPYVLAHWYRNQIAGGTTPGFDLVTVSLQEDCSNLDNNILDPLEDYIRKIERDVINDIGSDTSVPNTITTCTITYTDLNPSVASCSGVTITHNVLI